MVGGLALAGAGIPLAIVGGRKVPKEPGAAATAPVLLVGPGGAGVRWQF
jgi:hypothetical protein